jgi:hypothetical protein
MMESWCEGPYQRVGIQQHILATWVVPSLHAYIFPWRLARVLEMAIIGFPPAASKGDAVSLILLVRRRVQSLGRRQKDLVFPCSDLSLAIVALLLVLVLGLGGDTESRGLGGRCCCHRR